ncbi:EAL domain-containing protein [Thalassotalea ganghwensis]
MFTFTQVLIRNLITAIAFSAISIGVATIIIKPILRDSTQHHDVFFTQMLDSDSELTDLLLKQLNKNKIYQKLEVINAEQETIFNQVHDANVLQSFLAPKERIIRQNNITIKYQLSYIEQLNLLTQIFLFVIVLSIIFALVLTPFSVNRASKLINQVADKISLKIKQISGENITDADLNSCGVLSLPQVKSSVSQLEKLLNQHVEGANVLAKEAYIEPLTQLENRSRFVQFFENSNDAVEFGVLTITRCSELQTINQIHGYHEGDNYIIKVADIIKSTAAKFQGAQIFRLNSSDFATILPNITFKEAENYAQQLTDQFNQYQQNADLDSVGYTGLVAFNKDKPLGELLALVDTGISIAQTKKVNSWYAQRDSDILENSSSSYGNQNWRQEIDNVLENQRIKILVQHIKPTSRNNKVYGEILTRFINSSDEMLPTASFIAMAEKLDKIVAVDRMIVDNTIEQIKSMNLTTQSFGLNLSARSIHDEHFLIWLERRLLRDSNVASSLVFEITEYGLQQNIKTSKRFIDMLHRVGSRVTVERFGVGLTSFKFFRDLKPDFIKMDSTYTRDIDEDKNNQYFLRLMIDLAHRLSITVLAESVETQEEKFTLEKLFIDGCQGYYLGKPEPL